MWFKNKPKDKCNGAVCAYEFDGELFHTAEERDQAIHNKKKERLESFMGSLIKECIHEISPGKSFTSSHNLGKHLLKNWDSISRKAREYRELLKEETK